MHSKIERLNYPRVSEIIEPWTQESYKYISEDILENAAHRGTEVHAYCTAHVRNDFMPFPSAEIAAYLHSFTEWWDTLSHPFLMLSERRLYDDDLQYSGQADLIFEEKGIIYLADIKTSANFKPTWLVQLAAYVNLAQKAGYKIQKGWILHLRCQKKWANDEKSMREYAAQKIHRYEFSIKELQNAYWTYFVPSVEWHKLLRTKFERIKD